MEEVFLLWRPLLQERTDILPPRRPFPQERTDILTPEMLTEYLCKIIKNRLSDENLSSKEKMEFVNRLIDSIGEDASEKLVDEKQMLSLNSETMVSRSADLTF